MAVNNKYSVSSGELRKVVLFQNSAPANNSSGGQTDNYTDLLTTRCKLADNSGNKRLESGEIVFVDSRQIICRYQLALANGINSDTRVLIDGQVYRILDFGLTDPMTKHYYYFNLSVNA